MADPNSFSGQEMAGNGFVVRIVDNFGDDRPHARHGVVLSLELRSSTLVLGPSHPASSAHVLAPWRCSLYGRHPDLASSRADECGITKKARYNDVSPQVQGQDNGLGSGLPGYD